jgi:hypothetical protein
MFISDELFLSIKQIAEENPDGFTIDLRNLQHVTSGIVVAYAATQNSFGNGGLYQCIEHGLYNSGFLGGWLNPDGEFQYDSCRIFHDREAAIEWGRKQMQYSIYDLDTFEEIIL